MLPAAIKSNRFDNDEAIAISSSTRLTLDSDPLKTWRLNASRDGCLQISRRRHTRSRLSVMHFCSHLVHFAPLRSHFDAKHIPMARNGRTEVEKCIACSTRQKFKSAASDRGIRKPDRVQIQAEESKHLSCRLGTAVALCRQPSGIRAQQHAGRRAGSAGNCNIERATASRAQRRRRIMSWAKTINWYIIASTALTVGLMIAVALWLP